MARLKFKDKYGKYIEVETKDNKVNTISSTSSNQEYPSAKAVFDYVGNIETVLDEIRGVANESNQ